MKVNRNLDNSDNNNPKTKLIIFGVFAVAILVFGVLQMQANIKGPFQLGDEYSALSKNSSDNIGTCTGPDCLSDVELREKDTDKDGLSDWEEINIYGTSAYLPDSDSDNISDYDEIQQGTDPNCAEGSDCSYNNFDSNDLEIDSNSTGEENLDYLGNNISVPEDDEKLKEALSGSISLEDLKSLLLESGVDKKTIESFSDEELKKLYQDTLADMSGDFNSN
jgi:hypothetical protein